MARRSPPWRSRTTEGSGAAGAGERRPAPSDGVGTPLKSEFAAAIEGRRCERQPKSRASTGLRVRLRGGKTAMDRPATIT
jgi:hypothetical protein